MLAEQRDHVDPEAVDAAPEPEAQHVAHGGAHRRIGPVEVRLLLQERVEVELPRRRVPLPGTAAERGHVPVRRGAVRRADRARRTSRASVTAATSATPRTRDAGRRCGWARSPAAASCRVRAAKPLRPVEVGEAAEERVDVRVVGDVVAEVGHRRAEDRRQPDRVDAQPLEVVQAVEDARAGRRRRRRCGPGTSAGRSGRPRRAATTDAPRSPAGWSQMQRLRLAA